MQEAMDEVKMVVEGVYSAKAALALAEKYNVSMPIVEQVNEVLFKGKNVKLALKDLMSREKRDEIVEYLEKTDISSILVDEVKLSELSN